MSTSDPSGDRRTPGATPDDAAPTETSPTETTPTEAPPTETISADAAPDATPADTTPADPTPAGTTSPQTAAAADSPAADPAAVEGATTDAARTASADAPSTRPFGSPTPAAQARAAAPRVAADPGRHATARPTPVPPEPAAGAAAGAFGAHQRFAASAPDASPDPVGGPATAPLPPTHGGPPVAPPPPEPGRPFDTAAAPITPEPPVEDPSLFPAPNAPRSPSAGSHILGVIVGLILGPVAVAGVLLGQSRILVVQADHWDASLDVLGIVLVSVGLLLLACVLLLGAWTAAVPITAGIVLSALGGFYLYAPGIARRETLRVLTSEGWHTQVTQVTVVGTSGTLLVAGFMLLVGGLVIAGARRHGIHLGEFRERNRA
ncbi:hypothetical protein [Cellulomonas alba]|uniref:Uncharacterized protein n=1 Tax=Cellulomonas alba TaxID=3053467 RepID=A0ABT7SE81_9CELL|nr:hypothetical protein [Cellulomonas alba]MDM7854475.1 hypothetical protein [Cellulomonas alba]